MGKKVLFVATVDFHFKAFHLPTLDWFKEQGWETHVLANGDLTLPYTDKKFNICIQRSPFSFKNIRAYKEIKRIINENNYDVIHCHTPMGGVLARLAARKARKLGTKVIYTAHGFHFYKGSPLLNWIIYFPIEKICSYFTDVLITINNEDFELAKKKMNAKKVRYIPGVGVDIEKFSNIFVDKMEKRQEIGVPQNSIVLFSVGELNKNKNHEVIIRAMSKINNENIYYIIAGKGVLKEYLIKLSESLNINDRVRLIGFRKDIGELCKIADVFCFPSKREGLGLASLEAMASGLPLITSNVHGIVDYSVNVESGFNCSPEDVDCFALNIEKLINDKALMDKMIQNNVVAVEKFSIKNSMDSLKNIYSEVFKIDDNITKTNCEKE